MVTSDMTPMRMQGGVLCCLPIYRGQCTAPLLIDERLGRLVYKHGPKALGSEDCHAYAVRCILPAQTLEGLALHLCQYTGAHNSVR